MRGMDPILDWQTAAYRARLEAILLDPRVVDCDVRMRALERSDHASPRLHGKAIALRNLIRQERAHLIETMLGDVEAPVPSRWEGAPRRARLRLATSDGVRVADAPA